jgi:hypothetical protein
MSSLISTVLARAMASVHLATFSRRRCGVSDSFARAFRASKVVQDSRIDTFNSTRFSLEFRRSAVAELRVGEKKEMRSVRKVGFKGVALASVLVGSVGFVLVGSEPAQAARPNNQACLGIDFSTFARQGSSISGPGAEFGQFDARLAQTYNGLGGPIQYHLAGGVITGLTSSACYD